MGRTAGQTLCTQSGASFCHFSRWKLYGLVFYYRCLYYKLLHRNVTHYPTAFDMLFLFLSDSQCLLIVFHSCII